MEKERAVIENLQDAGCDEALIEAFLRCCRTCELSEQMGLLSRHRSDLLAEIRAGQKKLDCLDFLMFQMRKEQEHDS